MICLANKTAFSAHPPMELALFKGPYSRGLSRWDQMFFDFVCSGGGYLSPNFFISFPKNFLAIFTCSSIHGLALSYATPASKVT